MARCLLLAALLLKSLSAVAADVRLVARTGVAIDGIGVSAIDGPKSTTRSVVFRGETTSITVGGITLSSGDALPSALDGTVQRIRQGAVAGDRTAVLATTSGTVASSAILLVQRDTTSVLVSTAAGDGTTILQFTMNAAGDVAYQTRSRAGGAINVLRRNTTTPETISGPTRLLGRQGGLVIDENGAVAWTNDDGDVLYWSDALGVVDVHDNGPYLRPLGSAPIALDATFGLAYVTEPAAVRWQPATGEYSQIIPNGTNVEGYELLILRGEIGYLDDGTVTLRPITEPSLGADSLCVGAVARRCPQRGRSSAGVTVEPQRANALFETDRERGVRAVVGLGAVVPGTGTLTDVTAHAVSGSTTVFIGVLDDGRSALVRATDGTLTSLTTSDALDLSGPLYGVSDLGVLLGTPDGGLILVGDDGRGRSVRPPRSKRFREFFIDAAAITKNRVIAVGGGALFAAPRRRLILAPVARPHRGKLRDPEMLAGSPTRVAFAALGADESRNAWVLDGRRAKFDGVLPSHVSMLAVDNDRVAALAPRQVTADGSDIDTIWSIETSGPVPLVGVGDATPLGTITSLSEIAVVRDEVMFTAALTGKGARSALLAIDIRP